MTGFLELGVVMRDLEAEGVEVFWVETEVLEGIGDGLESFSGHRPFDVRR